MNPYITQILTKAILFIFLAIFFIQCGSDNTAREAAIESAKKDAAAQKDTPSNETTPARPAVVGSLPMSISNASATKGSETCLSVMASQFNQIVSMQYTMIWNPEILKFKEVKSFGLPGMAAQNFGTRAADKGILAYSWFDANVQGISQPDGVKLYDVCFDVIGKTGSSTTVEFADTPVVIEISNADSQFLDIAATNGEVEIK